MRPAEGLQTYGDGPYPAPHNQPRSTSMDPGCWEVKWGYREDAVSALMVSNIWTRLVMPDSN